jgi:uracil-DNA glycosylase
MVGVDGDAVRLLPREHVRDRGAAWEGRRACASTMDEPTRSALREVLRGLAAHVERQRECGAPWLPRGGGVAASGRAVAGSEPGASASTAVRAAPRTAELFSDPGLQRADRLEALRAHIGDCTRCKLARCGRTQIVFGVGNPNAALMFVGEGPGRDEDQQGEPFVGRAGQLLTEIITKGMKLRRQDVYIANVVKCRPPENRNPEPDEIAACMPFLARQVDLVRPRVIVALGTFAAQTLLGVRTPITRMRGAWQDYRGVKVMPTFHPAYLLRTPADKRVVWADIKLVMAELGLPA